MSRTASTPAVASSDRAERLEFLATRRSVPIAMLGEPGPDPSEVRRLLTIATRVPDHGMLEPWRLIVIEGDARRRLGERLAPIFVAENATMEQEKREKFASTIARVFTHAPLVVVVVSRVDPAARISAWEQELSAGAVCMNLLHAAGALGFAGSWLTGWTAYSEGARGVLGLSQGEKIAGVIHIGAPKEAPADRKRPDLDAIATWWRDEGTGAGEAR
ncbi:MAG TPA: nitroreductase [Rhodoblastus sp.]|nr:nitroreductase [Rhodoblastus sp.]